MMTRVTVIDQAFMGLDRERALTSNLRNAFLIRFRCQMPTSTTNAFGMPSSLTDSASQLTEEQQEWVDAYKAGWDACQVAVKDWQARHQATYRKGPR